MSVEKNPKKAVASAIAQMEIEKRLKKECQRLLNCGALDPTAETIGTTARIVISVALVNLSKEIALTSAEHKATCANLMNF